MKKLCPVFVVILCLICCLVFVACGQANSVPEATPAPAAESTPEPTPEPTPIPTSEPTPVPVDYEALAARMNADLTSPLDDVEAKLDAANTQAENGEGSSENVDSTEILDSLDTETMQAAALSGVAFDAGDDALVCRLWTAIFNKEFIDILGMDGTESSSALYSEFANSFISSFDRFQAAVSLYEPNAKMVLHVVENSESTDPIIVVEDGQVTYDYAAEQGYFAAEEAASAGEAAG